MNKSQLKAYAPAARRDFIRIVEQRAELLGLRPNSNLTVETQGEFTLINGRPYPKAYAQHHERLSRRIAKEGFAQFVEEIAYSWFNRIAALRFMEVNNFISHGFRVLSNRDAGKNEPEILEHAAEIELAGLNREKVIELKIAGNKDAELYRMLLIAQCNELNRAMPFLFERVGDETEMLLPDNLLNSDSVIRKMVSQIDETNWRDAETQEPNVEIIGWLYQFYISEKKDEVIGKTVKSEDIPAATQLFTPNWIVKYMTQNSIGRLWCEANPHSQLAAQMEFYIKPADERNAVILTANKSQQDAGVPVNPEEITILDPACGSGHILVEAYELLKAIYTERGYSSRDIPLLILEKNLFGLDIDERAAQMASFALLMKARKDDRRIFERLADTQIQNPKSKIPNIETVPDSSQLANTPTEIAQMFFSDKANPGALPIRDNSFLFNELETQPSLILSEPPAVAGGLNANSSAAKLNPSATADGSDLTEQNVADLLELFEQGKTLGSLIRVPHEVKAVVDKLETAIQIKSVSAEWMEQIAARSLAPFVRAAKMLARRYDCVIANPPYMGGKGMNAELKSFAAKNFPDSRSDLFSMFIERNFELTKKDGFLGFMTPFVWMFLSSYKDLRDLITSEKTILSLVRPEYNAFWESAHVAICTFVLFNGKTNLKGDFFDLSRFYGAKLQPIKLFEAINNSNCEWRFQASTDDFNKIPGSPIAYQSAKKLSEIFEKFPPIGIKAKKGLTTADNARFLRLWFEISLSKFSIATGGKWYPTTKGGDFRKWYGNHEYVINWENNGFELKNFPQGVVRNESYYFRDGVTWNGISSSSFNARVVPEGFICNAAGPMIYGGDKYTHLGMLNSVANNFIVNLISPTLNYEVGTVASIPMINSVSDKQKDITKQAEEIARADWDSFETSWDFSRFWILDFGFWIKENPNHGLNIETEKLGSIEYCWQKWKELCETRIRRMQELETENNRLFIEAYGLQDELAPEVPLSQITLMRADAVKDTRRLLSYFIGCLMGRYSLDRDGLVYADAGSKGFDATRYQTFPADDDGIVPVTDLEWFPQEAARQFEQFIAVAFRDKGQGARDKEEERETGKETNSDPLSLVPRPSSFAENLRWIAEQLGGKPSETPIETVRRYFSTQFFKDHLQTYKKRPIYWLFSSGKQKAFECLVYLHRYNETTLPRMRHEYVLPLMSKLEAQIETLAGKSNEYGTRTGGLIDTADSTSEKSKLTKQKEILLKKQAELAAFDEKLRHYSDMRISLDLDDGVKVNYGKFGDLLAEVRLVATTKE